MRGNVIDTPWQGVVWPFKAAIRVLVNPVPQVFDALSRVTEYVNQLSLDLPLIEFSPFEILPRHPVDASDVHTDVMNKESLQVSESGREGSEGPLMPFKEVGRATIKMPDESMQSAAHHPVFSFKRPESSVEDRERTRPSFFQRSGASKEKDASASMREQKSQKSSLRESCRPSSTVTVLQPEGSPVANNVSELAAANLRSAGDQSLTALRLLDEVAESLMEESEKRFSPEHSVNNRVEKEGPERKPSNLSYPQEAHQIPSSSRTVVEPKSCKYKPAFSAAVNDKKSQFPKENPPRTPGGAIQKNMGDHTILLIDSLVDQLLAAEDNPKSRKSNLSLHSVQKPAVSRSNNTTKHLSATTKVTQVANGSLVPERQEKSPRAVLEELQTPFGALSDMTSAHDPELVAERLTSWINDVLVAQARRHGVDLS